MKMISQWVRCALVVLVASLTVPSSIQQVRAQRGSVPLPAGTIVVVKIDEQVSGKTHVSGASVAASVARDVIVDSVLVIRIGTPVDATVASSSKAGAVGQAGGIAINIESTQSIDNQTVFLRGVYSAEGQSSMGTSVGAGVVVCPLFLLMKGQEGVINPGTEYQSRTQNQLTVQPPDKLTAEPKK